MRKVNARQFLEQSKHAAEWQRKTLNAARAAGHDVFQDCVMIDYAAIEQRVLALEGAPKKQLRNILFGMKYGMGSRKLYDYITSLDAFNTEAKLAADILIFERWQSEDRARIRRENAAIAYAAAEAGIVPPADRSCVTDHQGTITGRFTSNTPNFKEIDRVPSKWGFGTVDGRFVWNAPTEPESDMERDRR
jgi:hypothetical protein